MAAAENADKWTKQGDCNLVVRVYVPSPRFCRDLQPLKKEKKKSTKDLPVCFPP